MHRPAAPFNYQGRAFARFIDEIAGLRRAHVTANFSIGYCLVNRRYLGKQPAIVAPSAFMSDLSMPDRAYEAFQLARLRRPVMLLDMPGHGLSSPHTKRQAIDLCLRRDAASSVLPMLAAVQQVLGTHEPLDYFGVSHGGHLALKMAELDPVDRIGTVFGLDISGAAQRSTLSLQLGYIIMDGIIGRRRASRQLVGSQALAEYQAFVTYYAPHAPKPLPKFLANNPGTAALNMVASINARPSALHAWKHILDTKSARVSVVTAQNSHVSDAASIDRFIASLPAAQQRRCRQRIMPHEDHNIGMTELLPRAVSWAAEAYAAAHTTST